MLSPKRVTYRKVQRGRMHGEATRGNTLAFGSYGLISTGLNFISARQIEAARIAMTRHIKRGGKVWIRIFPAIPYTKKPAETRMGKGKGATEKWVAMVKPGTVMFEMDGVTADVARRAMELAGAKLPVCSKFIERRMVEVLE